MGATRFWTKSPVVFYAGDITEFSDDHFEIVDPARQVLRSVQTGQVVSFDPAAVGQRDLTGWRQCAAPADVAAVQDVARQDAAGWTQNATPDVPAAPAAAPAEAPRRQVTRSRYVCQLLPGVTSVPRRQRRLCGLS